MFQAYKIESSKFMNKAISFQSNEVSSNVDFIGN